MATQRMINIKNEKTKDNLSVTKSCNKNTEHNESVLGVHFHDSIETECTCNNIKEIHDMNNDLQPVLSATAIAVLSALEGPYKTAGQAIYWESVLAARRLILTLSVFVKNDIPKLFMLQTMCILNLIHHLVIKPFKNRKSNQAETLSLTLLVVITNINALKACFIEGRLQPDGQDGYIFSVLHICETLSLLMLASFIILLKNFL